MHRWRSTDRWAKEWGRLREQSVQVVFGKDCVGKVHSEHLPGMSAEREGQKKKQEWAQEQNKTRCSENARHAEMQECKA
jgi:hypothetical protein